MEGATSLLHFPPLHMEVMSLDSPHEPFPSAHSASARRRHLSLDDALAHYYGHRERTLSPVSLSAAQEAFGVTTVSDEQTHITNSHEDQDDDV
jgi:hypothetical protein